MYFANGTNANSVASYNLYKMNTIEGATTIGTAGIIANTGTAGARIIFGTCTISLQIN